jgi:dihydrofolate reductase
MIVSLIAALARNRVIGRENQLPWRLPEDLKRFKALTMGHPVLMGRKTSESIGKPLPGRLNLVVSRAGLSFDDALSKARDSGTDELFVIGGAQIYEKALPLADRMYLTLIDSDVEGDAYFPQWDPGEFRETAREPRDGFSFVNLERVRR